MSHKLLLLLVHCTLSFWFSHSRQALKLSHSNSHSNYLGSALHEICTSIKHLLFLYVKWCKPAKNSTTYHEVAYNTNTLAALEIARRASLDTFTPSGIWEILNKNKNSSKIVTIYHCSDITLRYSSLLDSGHNCEKEIRYTFNTNNLLWSS